jgi:hypothetical protein
MRDAEQFGTYLSFVYIDARRDKVAVNAEDKWSKKLPAIFKEKDVEDAVHKLCDKNGIDYVSADNIKNNVKEAIKSYFERKKQAELAAGDGENEPQLTLTTSIHATADYAKPSLSRENYTLHVMMTEN